MKRILGHHVTRPGRTHADAPVAIPVAKDLEGAPGVPRREAEVSFYSREQPLESVAVSESASAEWAAQVRDAFNPEATRLYEEHARVMQPFVEWIRATGDLEPRGTPSGEDVTEAIRRRARELGYGEVGFTHFDYHYVYASHRKYLRRDLPHAICLALEQDYEATQTIPSLEAEAAQGQAYERQARLTMELVDFILSLGYRVQVSGPAWYLGPVIPMFVEAGLGQLGVNGQLLSPHFGSRARLQIILTNARVTYDKPVDYGIPNLCALCQVCTLRCPGRALNEQRIWYRGVEKTRLAFERCRPVMAHYSGCGICIKVCPVQRYGLGPVMEHYLTTGEVLGKGTHNLEGYTLPDKGYFKPGRLPTFDTAFFDMPRGATEELVWAEFRERLAQADGDAARERLWAEFRQKLEAAIQRASAIVDMGMEVRP